MVSRPVNISNCYPKWILASRKSLESVEKYSPPAWRGARDPWRHSQAASCSPIFQSPAEVLPSSRDHHLINTSSSQPAISPLIISRSPADVSPHGQALRPVKRTGLISLRAADEQAVDPENPAMLSLPVAFVQGEKGKRGGFRVDYSNLLAGINWASDRAARDGVKRLDDAARSCLSTRASIASFPLAR